VLNAAFSLARTSSGLSTLRGCCQQRNRDPSPDHGSYLQHALVIGRKPIDAGRDDAVNRRWHVENRRKAGEMEIPRLPGHPAEFSQAAAYFYLITHDPQPI
jgi:hypothetical protein